MTENFLPHIGIAPSRRIMPADLAEELGVSEHYNPALEAHVLDVPAPLVEGHEELMKEGIALPSIQSRDAERVVVQIPPGTQTISQILGSIATDPQRYGDLFKGIGIQMKRAHEAGYGIMSIDKRRILGSIAFSPSEKGPLWNMLFFVPPYPFRKEGTLEFTSRGISHELKESGHFEGEDGKANANILLHQILLGIGTSSGRRGISRRHGVQ